MAVTGYHINVDFFLEITKDSMLKRIGYASDEGLSPRIPSLIEEYFEKAKCLIDPSYSYIIRDIDRVEEPLVFIKDSSILESHIISETLKRCRSVAIFTSTIGDELEKMVAWLGNSDAVLESYILDAIGSEMIEKAADFVHGIIGELANISGLAVSRRFSPGNCDWDISQQKVIFEALGDKSGGVELSHDYLMIPTKSISGIIGVGSAESGIATYNPCKTCTDTNCLWRRE
ncbi:MAG: hypothetical protein R6U37_02875 [Dehalococcoidia bacterium]